MNQLPHVYHELNRRTGAELVNETPSEHQVRVVFRVPKGAGTRTWLLLMDRLLEVSEKAPWTLDVSKQYFRLNGGLRYCWRIIFQGQGMQAHDQQIASSFQSVRAPASAQLTEVPLHGSPNRSPTAGLSGHVPVGPAAARRT